MEADIETYEYRNHIQAQIATLQKVSVSNQALLRRL
jgi:hypothetical protein